MKPTAQKSPIDLPRPLAAMLMGLSLAAFGWYGSAPEDTPPPLKDTTVPEEKSRRFHVTAIAVEAIEEGPCVIDIKLSYDGTKEFYYWYLFGPDVVLPNDWVIPQSHTDEIKSLLGSGKVKWIFESGVRAEGPQVMNPGSVVQERCYLHRRNSTQILAGKARLRVSWEIIQDKDNSRKLPVWERRKPSDAKELGGYAPLTPASFGTEYFCNMEEIGTPSTYLDLDVFPANPKNLAALRERLEQRLRPEASAEEIADVANHLCCTRHPALAPIAWRIIEGPYYNTVDYARLFQVVDDSTSEWREVEARLIRLVNNSTYGPRWLLFKYLAERNPAMSGNAFATLTSSDSIWTRVLTYLWFSKRCERLWATNVLSRLPELTQPLPQSEFARLLRDLDDDDFRVRERATARLTSFRERVEPQLKEASNHLPSLEAKRRVQFILEQIAAAKKAPEWKPILEYLSSGDCDRDAAVAILRALAQGNPDAELTKAAVATLNKLSTSK